jgi:hypothetical protein
MAHTALITPPTRHLPISARSGESVTDRHTCLPPPAPPPAPRWLPQLANLPSAYIHQPWLAPPEVLQEAAVELGYTYPLPLVGLKEARDQVAWAASVVERCSSSGDTVPCKQPYRPPSDPEVGAGVTDRARQCA